MNYPYLNESDVLTLDGVSYDLRKLWDLVKNNPEHHLYVDDLKWIINGEVDKEDRTIFTADLRVPLIVLKADDAVMVIAGLNQLRSANGEGLKMVTCLYATPQMLLQCEMPEATAQESLQESKKTPFYSQWK